MVGDDSDLKDSSTTDVNIITAREISWNLWSLWEKCVFPIWLMSGCHQLQRDVNHKDYASPKTYL